MSFEHQGLAFNLLDTPGHQDFQRRHLPHPYRGRQRGDGFDAASGSNPGIDQFQPATDKIPDVSRRQGGAAGPGDGGDARAGFGNRLPGATPTRGDVRELTRGSAIKGQYATGQILRENQVDNGLQGLPPPTLGQQGDAVEQLGLGDCRGE
jgi:hypothetical protein